MNTPAPISPLLAEDERRLNSERIEDLKVAISGNDAVLFIGSGPSNGIGYPAWGRLLTDLVSLLKTKRAFDEGIKESDPLLYAYNLKKAIIEDHGNLDRYYQKLVQVFSGKQHGELHRLLVELPCGIVTTNYDLTLSNALAFLPGAKSDLFFSVNGQSIHNVSQFLMSFNKSLRIPKRVAHLHGSVHQPNDTILCAEDYRKAYEIVNLPPPKDVPKELTFWGKVLAVFFGESVSKEELEKNYDQKSDWPLHRKVLWSLIATRRLVFVGFGMRDPYLRNLLKRAQADLWRWGHFTHFNIASISAESQKDDLRLAEELKDEFGIQTIFYEKVGHSHDLLTSLFKEIHQRCVPQDTPSNTITEQPTDTTNTNTSTQNSDWLKKINSKMEGGMRGED